MHDDLQQGVANEPPRLQLFGDIPKPRGLASTMNPGSMERLLPIVSNGIMFSERIFPPTYVLD